MQRKKPMDPRFRGGGQEEVGMTEEKVTKIEDGNFQSSLSSFDDLMRVLDR